MSAAVLARTDSTTQPLDQPFSDRHTCPSCGNAFVELTNNDKRRIAELESQVKILTDKAAKAVDKLADYEDQLQQLRSQAAAAQISSSNALAATAPSNTLNSKPSRFSLLTGRRPATPVTSQSSQPSNGTQARRESDLQAALLREQEARQRAEGKLSEMNTEIEDLSVQLFQQANEMVATERKARARLEERVEVLERRDDEKKQRLERLEGAMKRIERVRGLLGT